MNKKRITSLLAGIMAGILLLSLIFGLFATTAGAVSSNVIKEQIKELESKNQQMQDKIDGLKNQQSSNASEIEELMQQKAVIEQQAGLIHAQIRNVNAQISAYSALIADKQEELLESEKRLQELNAKHKERIRAMEEDGRLSYWSVLFQANSFSDFLDRLNMVREIEASDSRRLKEIKAAGQEVEKAKAELQTEMEALQKTNEDLAVMQKEQEAKSKEAAEVLNKLIAKGDEFAEAMHKYEHELAELEKEIAQAEIDYDAALKQEEAMLNNNYKPGSGANSNVGSSGDVGCAEKIDKNGIKWLVPCDYKKISSPFGNRWHPVYGGYGMHGGVDLDADCLMYKDGSTDSPIYATRDGVVIIAKESSTAGFYVTIDHGDGYKSTYMHMCCMPFVVVGQKVKAGQVIGCIGTTGTSTGDHLHFGIYKNGTLVNPMDYIG